MNSIAYGHSTDAEIKAEWWSDVSRAIEQVHGVSMSNVGV